MALTSFLQGGRCTIFDNLSKKTAIAINPLDSCKAVTKFVITCAHFLVGISSRCNNPAFCSVVRLLLSPIDFHNMSDLSSDEVVNVE